MDLIRWGHDHWGREIPLGMEHGLFWIALAVAALLVAGHQCLRALGKLKKGGGSRHE